MFLWLGFVFGTSQFHVCFIEICKNRDEAIARMLRALDEYAITGIKTTIPFHAKVLKHKQFIKGEFSTNFIEKYMSNQEEKEEVKV